MQISIICDFYKNSGYGHLSRCYALKRVFEHQNISVKLYLLSDKDNLENVITNDFCILNRVKKDIESVVKISDIIICDSYILELKECELLAKKQVFFYDDNFRLEYPYKSYIINTALGAENLNYKNKNRCILGSQYILLREDFMNTTERNIHKISNVFITLGATNNSKLIIQIIKKLNKVLDNVQIHLISNNFDKENLSTHNVSVYKNITATEIKNIMQKSDFAISAGGVGLLEIISQNLPNISIQIASNQKNNIIYLDKYNYTIFAGNKDDENLGNLLEEKIKFMKIEKNREKLLKNLEKIKFNENRLANKIIEIYKEHR